MAKAYVYYGYTEIDENTGYERPEKTLCFICAGKRALKADPKKEKIVFNTTDYESHQCEDCDQFLDDRVEI